MIPLRMCLALVLFAMTLIAIPAMAKKKPGPHPADTQKALTFLLAMSEQAIPLTSSCYGSFGVDRPPKVKDLLAMEFASLSRGQNHVLGKCSGEPNLRCTVSIAHSSGEDVSSADITFDIKDGRPDGLECVLTP
jgi:hypothetical protein